jgi:hypothetical protein
MHHEGDGVMVYAETMELQSPLSFKTAPPNVEDLPRTRFREPRNLPYKNAPGFMASLYYWWWAFLRRNTAYKRTCRQRGGGRLHWLYQDFGNVFGKDFMSWWSRHQNIFAERNERDQLDGDYGVPYWLDPRKPLNQIQEEIKALHMRAHALMPKCSSKIISSAKYPIYTNVSSHTLYKTLKIWDLYLTHPNVSAYDLGILAGFKPNLMPATKYGETRTQLARQVKEHNKKAKISIANQTNRYLRTARQYIENVGKGEFPKADKR